MLVRLVSGQIDRLCVRCPGGITRMKLLPMTKTWLCTICSGTEYYTPKQTMYEEWLEEQEEE